MTDKHDPAERNPPSPAWRRKMLFAALYFSEGAPIGFIWFVIPVQLRLEGLSIEKITWLSAILVIPWTLKFLWAPVVDWLRTARWTLHHWVAAAQTCMSLTLLPLVWLDPVTDFSSLAATLMLHAFAAATQDVSIDALCIASTTRAERGSYNGWMQVGMLLGRAAMGGGMLAVIGFIGQSGAVFILIVAIVSSMALLLATRLPAVAIAPKPARVTPLHHKYFQVLRQPLTWWGVAFALVGGAAFKSFEVVYPLYMVDRGFAKQTIGAFTAGPMIGTMVAGSILGGWWSDRFGCGRAVCAALLAIAGLITLLAFYDRSTSGHIGTPLLAILILIALAIGVFTAASYALFMNLTQPGIAATQFSTFMGAVNGCESWSVYVLGLLIAARGYDEGLFVMCTLSLLALPILARLQHSDRTSIDQDAQRD
jgi:MFS family permease